jgi:hypothetical protein
MSPAAQPPREVEFDAARLAATPLPICPVDRLPIRRRNQICLRIIVIGLVNFMLYTIAYAIIGGDAPNGGRYVIQQPDGAVQATYIVRGHFIRSLDGRERTVSRPLWIYSYIHSITLPLTSGAMIVCMLLLARPHIVATMRDSWLSGRTFVIGVSAAVILVSVAVSALFLVDFVRELAEA